MNSFKLGWFLAKRNIQHSSKWISFFTIFVIFLLFLTVMIISGILVGLIQGSEVAYRDKYFGDLTIAKLDKKSKIERSQDILSALNGIDGIAGVSARYISGGSVEANYLTRKSDDIANKKSASIRGIDPEAEDAVTKLSQNVLEGEYLKKEDASKYIMLGKDLLAKYSVVSDVDPTALRDVGPGTRVRIEISSQNKSRFQRLDSISTPEDSAQSYEYIVKGILKVKAGDLSSSIYMVDSELRKITGKGISDIDDIAIKVTPPTTAKEVKSILINNGFDKSSDIKTFEEGTPAFVVNMKNLFGFLGNVFGFILMLVAATVLFIVIFINALTKRRQIGILKGIGISKASILWSYIFQAVLYSAFGSMFGMVVAIFLLKPLFVAHPIDFPFSDGILVADTMPTIIKGTVLTVVAFFAGLLPSYMVVRRNTLNAILGRN